MVASSFLIRTMKKCKDMVGAIFIITIDPSKISNSTTPFAAIDSLSAIPTEEEILFTIHRIFCVAEINSLGNDCRLHEVHINRIS